MEVNYIKQVKALLILIILFLSIGTISASENISDVDNDAMDDSQIINEVISNSSNYVVGDDGNTKSFKDLQDFIDSNTNGTIDIDSDYKFDSNIDSKGGIKITKDLTINGNNHVIDADGKSFIFNITNSAVTISDLTFKNANAKNSNMGGAIDSTGDELIVNNCNFTNNTGTQHGGAINSRSTTTIINNANLIQADLEIPIISMELRYTHHMMLKYTIPISLIIIWLDTIPMQPVVVQYIH